MSEPVIVTPEIERVMKSRVCRCGHLEAHHAATVVNGPRDAACRGDITDKGRPLGCDCQGYEQVEAVTEGP